MGPLGASLTKLAEETPHRTNQKPPLRGGPSAIECQTNRTGHLLQGAPPETGWADKGAHTAEMTTRDACGQGRRGHSPGWLQRSEEHTSELQSPDHLVC